MKVFPETNNLFVFPPSIQDLEARLTKRGTETPESLKTRLGNAIKEISRGLMENDPTCLIGYKMVNKDLELAKKVFLAIIEGLY